MFELIPGFANFLVWEAKSKDAIDFKKVYVDVAGDLASGLMLSQIIYWYLPDKEGKNKLRIHKHGEFWIAKTRQEWWDEVRLAPREVDRALDRLRAAGIVETRVMRFNGLATTHVRIIPEAFMDALNSVAKDGKQREKVLYQRDGRRGKKVPPPESQICDSVRNHESVKPESQICDSIKIKAGDCPPSGGRGMPSCLPKAFHHPAILLPFSLNS